MPGAVIVADQPFGAGAGVPGTARNDLWLTQQVDLSVATGGNSSYQWDLLDKPPGSAVALATPTAATSSFTPDVIGTYRVRLITNSGGAGNVQILVFRVRYTNVGVLADRGWALPGLGESGVLENNYASNTRGYDEVLRFIFADLLPWAGGLNVMKNGSLVGQQRTVNLITGRTMTNNVGQNRVDVTLTDYLELPLCAVYKSSIAESPGEPLGARKLDLSVLPAGTKHFFLVATLVSDTIGADTVVELWNVTRAYMVTGATLDNTAAADQQIAETFITAELTVGTNNGDIRSDTADEYELRVYQDNGNPGDIVSCANAHLRLTIN